MKLPRSRRLKSRPQPIAFDMGPPIRPSGDLLRWLNRVNLRKPHRQDRRLLKLPICVQYSAPDQLGLGPAYIGTSLEDLEDGAIHLVLDDSALGQSLFSVFQSICPKDAWHCAFWMEGYWGPLVSSPFNDNMSALSTPHSGDGPFPFAVLKIGDRIDIHQDQSAPLPAFVYYIDHGSI